MAKAADRIQSIDKKISIEQQKSTERILKIINRESDTTMAIQLVDAEKKATAKKIDQWKNERQGLVSQVKARERSSRTSRLIQNGLLVEQYLNCKGAPCAVVKMRLEDIIQAIGNFPPVTIKEAERCIAALEKESGHFPSDAPPKNEAESAAHNE
jgi:hypothetical protein